MGNFKVVAKDGGARAGVLQTAHGQVETPVYMPVGTQGTVKALTPDDLNTLGTQIILGNTYHLYLRPGHKLIKKLGGLHKFMNWNGPILTDSGGFQAFSLGAMIEHGVRKIGVRSVNRDESLARGPLVSKMTEEGVEFVSHLDGTKHLLTPELSAEIQLDLGSDIVLALDELLSPLHDKKYVKESLDRTHRWELRSKDYFDKKLSKSTNPKAQFFGILQGVYDKEIREEEARWVSGQEFAGVSIGGSFGTSEFYTGSSCLGSCRSTALSDVLADTAGDRWGTPSRATPHPSPFPEWAAAQAIDETMSWVVSLLPDSLPRHALGIGEVRDVFACIERGIDMFDCVAPMRRARNGSLYIGPKNGGRVSNKYVLSISRSEFKDDSKPIDPGCLCYTCQNFSKAYLRHLYLSKELLYHHLATIHNVYFIVNLVKSIRESIIDHQFTSLKNKWIQ